MRDVFQHAVPRYAEVLHAMSLSVQDRGGEKNRELVALRELGAVGFYSTTDPFAALQSSTATFAYSVSDLVHDEPDQLRFCGVCGFGSWPYS